MLSRRCSGTRTRVSFYAAMGMHSPTSWPRQVICLAPCERHGSEMGLAPTLLPGPTETHTAPTFEDCRARCSHGSPVAREALWQVVVLPRVRRGLNLGHGLSTSPWRGVIQVIQPTGSTSRVLRDPGRPVSFVL